MVIIATPKVFAKRVFLKRHKEGRALFYHNLSEAGFIIPDFQQAGKILGFVENINNTIVDSVIVAENGLFIYKGSAFQYIGYSEIDSLTIDKYDENNQPHDYFTIILKDGSEEKIFIKTGRGEKGSAALHDLFYFFEFLNGVVCQYKRI